MYALIYTYDRKSNILRKYQQRPPMVENMINIYASNAYKTTVRIICALFVSNNQPSFIIGDPPTRAKT